MKKLLIFISLLFISNNMISQTKNSTENSEQKESSSDTFMTGRFFTNWSIGIAGGVNLYHGEGDSKGSFGKRFAPELDISVSKWIVPLIGLRVQLCGGKGYGWSDFESNFAVKPIGDLYYEKFNMVTGNVDILFNILDIKKHKADRKWSLVLYVGAGGARSWGNHQVNREFTLSSGILNKIRLTKRIDFTVDMRHMFVNSRFDEVTTYKGLYEGMTTVSVGLSYKLGKSGFVKIPKETVVRLYSNSFRYINHIDSLEYRNKRIIEDIDSLSQKNTNLEATLGNAANQGKAVHDTIIVEKIKAVHDTIIIEKIKEKSKYVTTPLILFFKINQATLDLKGLASLDFYIKHAIQGDKDKAFILTGSADIDTGNKTINQRLSEMRVDYVYDLLVNKYKIPKERLIRKAEGDTNNQFPEAILNRSVIIR